MAGLSALAVTPTGSPTRPPATPTVTLTPTATTQPPPRFTSLRFSTKPYDEPWQTFFVARTPQIYAAWDYDHMRDGMIVRRVWERNGEVWLIREQKWDFATNGARGTIDTVSIFDFEDGIEAGKYSLTLSIDGATQMLGSSPVPGGAPQENAIFWVLQPDAIEPLPSPDGSKVAWVKNAGTLVIQTGDNDPRELASAVEISSMDWFPNGRHLIYAVRDRSRQVNERQAWGIIHELWVLDVENGMRYRVSTKEENLHTPRVSPSGRYIAVLSGNQIGNTCFESPRLSFLFFDSALQRQAVHKVYEFIGLPFADPEHNGIHPMDVKNPVVWVGEHEATSGLWWSCLSSSSPPDGNYILDMVDLQAEKIGDS